MSERVHKREFLRRISRRMDVPEKQVDAFFNAFVDELSDIVANGGSLTLVNFGRFYLSKHPGHPMPFSKGDAANQDYYTLHFSAVRQLSSKLGERYEEVFEE